jgi:hypothetical protein
MPDDKVHGMTRVYRNGAGYGIRRAPSRRFGIPHGVESHHGPLQISALELKAYNESSRPYQAWKET